jgi:GntR family transcriptional regulator / MocR family aminotransferase
MTILYGTNLFGKDRRTRMSERASRMPFSVISINPAAPAPLYQQLYDEFRAAILAGRLKAGNKLPPTRELANELGISRNTVVAAYDQLLSEGYVEGHVGAGTWVTSALPEEMLQSRPIPARATRESPQRKRISKRGERLMAALPPIRPLRAGKMLPFRSAFPDLASFPFQIWTRLLAKYSRNPSHDLFGYAHVAGYPRLREAIAAYLRSARAVKCEADQVIIVPGTQVALELATQVLLDPGDTVLMEDPGYFGVRGVFIRADAQIVPVPVDKAGIRIDVVKGDHDNARMVYITPSHQFPLGVTLPLSRRLELLEWASRAGAWIIEDDCDGEYRYAGRPLASLQGLDNENRVIYTGTFSKVLFPSLRIGYLVVPRDLADAFIACRVMVDLQPATIPQAALADFIEEGHFTRHLRRMRNLYGSRQSLLLETARAELSGLLEIQESEAGMHLVGWLPPGVSDTEAARVASARDVLALPLSAFSLQPVTRGALMLGYTAFDEREIRAGARRLKTALAEVQGVKIR